MRIFISYFYQIRFFRRNMIPLSTAISDPKWYHNFRDKSHTFLDKNGVLNGCSINSFKPGSECHNLCKGSDNCATHDPNSCEFLRAYREQLSKLDFCDILRNLETFAYSCKDMLGFNEEPIIVLIVHEAPENLCSERRILRDWFQDHGYLLPEWSKDFF